MNGITIIDLHKEYPGMDLKLSDIADVSYISLKGKDSAIFKTDRLEYNNAIFIDSNYIFIADCTPIEYDRESKTTLVRSDAAHLYMFDTTGNFIKTIVSPGIQDDQFLGFGMNFTVHPKSEIVTVHGTTQDVMKVFDFNGNLVDCYNLGKRYYANTAINDTILFLDTWSRYIKNDGSVKDNGQTLMYYDLKFQGQITGPDIDIPAIHSRPGSTTISKFVRTQSGVYVVTPRSDTIYHISNNLEVIPKFVTIWKNSESDHCVIPIAETPEYVLFSSDIDYISKYKNLLPIRTYFLDKNNNQIYKVNCRETNSDGFEKSIFSNQLLLGSYNTTQTPNTLAYILTIQYLKENYNLLPSKLKQMTDIASEDDNPILMIIKFKESLIM